MSVSTLEHLRYEERGDTGVWIIDDFTKYFHTGEIEAGETHYREHASSDSMDSTVVVLENTENMGAEISDSLDHTNKEWSTLADEVNSSRLAYVADGMMSTAVKAEIDAAVETESFGSSRKLFRGVKSRN